MRNLIDKIYRHAWNRESLVPYSAGITVLLLSLIFGLTQLFGLSSRIEKEQKVVRIELREHTPPLEIAPKKEMPSRQKAQSPVSRTKSPENVKTKPKQSEPAKPQTTSADLSTLLNSFNTKQLLKNESNVRRTVTRSASQSNTISQTMTRSSKNATSGSDLSVEVSSRQTPVPGGRGGSLDAASIASIDVGRPSNGAGSASEIASDVSGSAGTGRVTRASGGGGSSVAIALPVSDEGEKATIDIHELIEWMKAHPGEIPRLVGYEMGHDRGADLSSAVNFSMQGRQFTLFLSVNEKELLLRICLIENDDFTLLKDNGIREKSNFLTSGNVLRESGGVNSLISSRSAPQGKASEFYDIFWRWWEVERTKT